MFTVDFRFEENQTTIEFPCNEEFLSAKFDELGVKDKLKTSQYVVGTNYCRAYISLQNAKDADFSDEWMIAEGLSYSDMNKAYVDSIEEDRTDKLVREKFDEEYINFKEAMVSKSSLDVFESCYKIAAMEDVYFYVTESKIFTPEEKEYILNSGDYVLTDLMQAWYDYGDWSDRVSDSVDNTFSERMSEYQKSLDNSEDCEEELE